MYATTVAGFGEGSAVSWATIARSVVAGFAGGWFVVPGIALWCGGSSDGDAACMCLWLEQGWC